MDISSIGGNGPIRSHSPVFQHASPAGAGANSSKAVNDANKAEIAKEKPLPVLGAPEVEREEGREKTTTESSRREGELSQEEKDLVDQLKQIDREVRAHEQAHLSAAGPYATGGASFQTTTGPDGKAYAVAGEVGIDASPERDPAATIQKMQVVRAAALAPADPSAQDQAVAASAAATESAARVQLASQQRAEQEERTEEAKVREEAVLQGDEVELEPLPPLGDPDGPPPPPPAILPTETAATAPAPDVVPPGSGDRVEVEALPVLGQGEPLPPKGQSVAERIQERNNVAPFTTEKSSSPAEIAAKSYERGAQLDDGTNVDVIA